MEKSFATEFNKLKELGESTFVLRGSTLIVEILPAEEIKTAGGLIMAAPSDHVRGNSIAAHKVDVARVLMCGQGYDEEADFLTTDSRGGIDTIPVPVKIELEVKPGAIILLPQYAAQLLSHFPGISRPTSNRLAMVKMDQVMAYYPSEEAYNVAKTQLNG